MEQPDDYGLQLIITVHLLVEGAEGYSLHLSSELTTPTLYSVEDKTSTRMFHLSVILATRRKLAEKSRLSNPRSGEGGKKVWRIRPHRTCGGGTRFHP